MFRSESEFVHWLERRVGLPGRGLKLGIGDDAALVSVAKGWELILSTDLSIEGIHFRSDLHSAASVGHRALARSLSDIAAMGGVPRFALVSLALPRRVSREWVRSLYAGMSRLARRYGVAIIGGDTAIVPDRITVDVVVAGEVPKGKALRRSGARPGDILYVSGRLGLSALGLSLLKAGTRRRSAWSKAALRAHLWPQPQCALGQFLAAGRRATALIDISDGLSTDLARLCQASGVGARIWESEIPVPVIGAAVATVSSPSPSCRRRKGSAPAQSLEVPKLNPLQLALHGGEDYQLLFTVPPRRASRIPPRYRGVRLRRIGEIRKGNGIGFVRASGRQEALTPAGFDHFQQVR